MVTDSSDQLIDLLRQTGVLEPAQLGEVTGALRQRFRGAQGLARELLQRGWLTPYQVNHLLQGRTQEVALGGYVLLDRLGEGGMGQVFKARHRRMGRLAALKIVRKERLANPDAVRRFRREIEAAAQLDHPNIVRAFDADEVNGTHFFAMEYVEGVDLSKLVKTRGPLPVATACDYIRQAAVGLQHAFERGLVHRDIKPANLLLTIKGDVVKVLDMGLARLERADSGEHSSTLTQEGSVMGTPDYIAPEQARDSHTADIRADLYSLGCALYYLLTGQVPFPGGTLAEKLLKHQLDQPRPVRELRPEVPGAVVAVLNRLIAKRPQDRYQTPAELAAALQTALRPAAAVAKPRESADETFAFTDNALPSPADTDSGGATMPLVKAVRQRLARDAEFQRRLLRGALYASPLVLVLLLLVIFRPFSANDVEPPAQPVKPTPRPVGNAPPKEDPAAIAQKKREGEADDAWKPLAAKLTKVAADPDPLRQELLDFRRKHYGTPAALQAAIAITRLPSPMDRLDPAKIPEDARAHWKATGFDSKDVVAVLGEHRGRHWDRAGPVAIDPKGRYVASGGAGSDKTIYIWDAETLALVRTLKSDNNDTWDVRFSPDGQWLLSCGKDPVVRVWDIGNGKEILQCLGHSSSVGRAAFSADGQRALSAGYDGTVRYWDLKTGKELKRFWHKGEIADVKFSADERFAISAGWTDKTVRMWDIQTGEQIHLVQADSNIWGLAIAPDGDKIAVTAGNDLSLWDWKRGKRLLAFKGHTKPTRGIVFSSDGSRLLSGSEDGTLRLWDVTTAEQLKVFSGHTNEIHTVTFTPDGKRAVSGSSDGTIRLWDVDTCKEVNPLKGSPAQRVAFSPDGETLAILAADRTISFWDLTTSKERLKPVTVPAAQTISPPVFSPDGRHLAVGTSSNLILLVDTTSGQTRALPRTGSVLRVAFNKGDLLASAEGGDGIKIWNVATGELQGHLGKENNPSAVAFSPSGREVAFNSNDHSVRICDVATGREIRSLPNFPNVHCLAFGFDGGIIAREGYGSFDLSPDRRVRAVFDTTGVMLQDVVTGKPISTIALPGPVLSVAFAADGRHLATANANGTVYILRLSPPPPDPHVAEPELQKLLARAADPKADREVLRQDVVQFRIKFAGLPQHQVRAAELLTTLPSPLDKLDPAKIPEDAKAAWKAAGLQMPKELVAVLGEHRGRHGDPIRCAVYSPDGKLIASGGLHIRIWDAETLHERAVLRVPQDMVNCLAFSPNRKLLLSGTHRGDVRLWDVDSGKLVRELVGPEAEVTSLAFSADGTRALSSGKTIVLCDVDSGKEVGRFDGHTDLVTSAAFSPDDGRIVSTSYDKTVRVWDVAKRTEIRRFDRFTNYITSRATFSPDGERILFGDHADVTRLWDVKTGKEVLRLERAGAPQLSRDGKRILAWDGNQGFILWDAQTGKQLPAAKAPVDPFSTAAMSADGTRIVTGGIDGTLRLWDMRSGRQVQPPTGSVGAAGGLAFSPDDSLLLSGAADKTVRLWQVSSGKEIAALPGLIDGDAFVTLLPDGGRALSVHSEKLRLWEVPTGKVLRELGTAPVSALAVSPDGRRAASSGDTTVRVWDLEGTEMHRLDGLRQPVAVAFSADGRRLAAGSFDGLILVWQADTGKELHRLEGHNHSVKSLAFSPDGRWLASASYDQTVRIWDLQNPSEARVLKGPMDLRSVAFAPDSKRLVSAGGDGRLVLWDPTSGAVLHQWQLPGAVHRATFAADGRHLATANGNGTVYILRLSPPRNSR
jgi:WD40 repeat protein